jgi:hypothetical protein
MPAQLTAAAPNEVFDSVNLRAAEGMNARECFGALPVDVEVADVKASACLGHAVAIRREQRPGQPELGVVRDLEGMLEVACARDREHRPEDLFLRDPCAWMDVAEDGRLDVVAALERSTSEQECSLVAADVDVVEHSSVRGLVDHWSKIGAAVRRIADSQLPCELDDPWDELVVDGVDDDRARAGRALWPW